MQHHAADQLHIEMTHAENSLACFTHHCEGLRKDLIEDRTLVNQVASICKTFLKSRRLARNWSSDEGDLLFQQVDIGKNRLVALQLAGIRVTQQELEHG